MKLVATLSSLLLFTACTSAATPAENINSEAERLMVGAELEINDFTEACMRSRGFAEAESPDDSQELREARTDALNNTDGYENLTQEDKDDLGAEALSGQFTSPLGCESIAEFALDYKVSQALGPDQAVFDELPDEATLESDAEFGEIIDRWSDCMAEEGFEDARSDEDVEALEQAYYEANPDEGAQSGGTDSSVPLGDGLAAPSSTPPYVTALWAAHSKCTELVSADAQQRAAELSGE